MPVQGRVLVLVMVLGQGRVPVLEKVSVQGRVPSAEKVLMAGLLNRAGPGPVETDDSF